MQLPSTEKKDRPHNDLASTLAAREKGVQLAMCIPAGGLIGWLAGAGLDHWLHTGWLHIAGVLLGAVGGFVQMVRVALRSIK